MNCLTKYVLSGAAAVCVFSCNVNAQTTLNVDTGQTLDQRDLEDGDLNGELFTLGPGLTIEVNDGGRVLDVGDLRRDEPFSFVGSFVNVNQGGTFGSFDTYLSDINLTVLQGGKATGVSLASGAMVSVQGGELLSLGQIDAGSSVTMSAGKLSSAHSGLTGGPVTVTGGELKTGFTVASGGVLLMSGGEIGGTFEAQAEFLGPGRSDVSFIGGEFKLNGSPVIDLSAGLGRNDLLTGTLADGSVFIISEQAFDTLAAGTTSLVSAPLASIDTTPQTVSTGVVSGGLREGQSLTLLDGGALGNNFSAVGATLNIHGGSTGENLEVAYSTVNITGGQIGSREEVIGDAFSVYDGSVVDISGGLFSDKLRALEGSSVAISGGIFQDGIRAMSGSSVELIGADFQFNGALVSQLDSVSNRDVLTGTLADGTVFVLANQSTATGAGGGSQLVSGTTSLTTSALPPPDITPMVVSSGFGPQGLRPGQILTLSGGGELGDSFAAAGATLIIQGGTVGDLARIANSQVDVSGGRIEGTMNLYRGTVASVTDVEFVQALEVHAGSQLTVSGGMISHVTAFDGGEVVIGGGDVGRVSAYSGGSVVIYGGTIGDGPFNSGSINDSVLTIHGGTFLQEFSVAGGELNILGGIIDDDQEVFWDGVINLSGGIVSGVLEASSGSTVNVAGGEVGLGLYVGRDSFLNISGGAIGPSFTALSQSETNLFVRELLIDGLPIDLELGVPMVIPDRDGAILSAILADGSSFDLTLNQALVFGQDWVEADAVLTATLVPEPTSLACFAVGGLILSFRYRPGQVVSL